MRYVTLEGYLIFTEYSEISDNQAEKLIEKAENTIDIITFSRINEIGFENLTQYQQEMIKRAVFMQCDFMHEYCDIIGGMLTGYSVNGVSMSFDSSKIVRISGATTSAEIYGIIVQTGLAYRGGI